MDTHAVADSPYVGLQPYTVDDHKYFFGRAADSRIISSNLFAAPLTVLYGASGVGKSSVLQAGVIPLLYKSPRTAVVSFQRWPEKEPIQILKTECLTAIHAAGFKEVQIDTALPYDEFLFLAAKAFHGTILIILDQFEEYFLYHREAENSFDAEFARAVNREEIDANFLIALREDSLSMLDRFRTRIPNLVGNSLRLRHLDAASAREAICKPLEVYNQEHPENPPVTIEESLVKELIQEVRAGKLLIGQGGVGRIESRNEPADSDIRIETPFLQLVLTRLWDKEMRQGSGVLRLKTLSELGGAKQIVRTHLDDAMNGLPPEEQEIAANIFRYLVTPSGTKIAYTVQDLAYYAKSAQTLEPVLEQLAKGSVRILRKVTSPGESTRYEIFHDVLAPAILDWRGRYEVNKELSQQRISLLKQQQERMVFRWIAIGALADFFSFLLLPIGASVLGSGLRKLQPPLSSQQIRSIVRIWSAIALVSAAITLVIIIFLAIKQQWILLFLIFSPLVIFRLLAPPFFSFRKYMQFSQAQDRTALAATDPYTSAQTPLS